MYFYDVHRPELLCTHLYVPPIHAGMRDTCMNPDVEFTVFKIVFSEILSMLWITKTYFFLQESHTNLELNT